MTSVAEARIEADPELPIIHIIRDFTGTVEQLMRAHLDPALFVQWNGPDSLTTAIDYWDARTGGSWRYVSTRGDEEFAFRGCFHEVGADRIVQTFTWEGQPEAVALGTARFTDLGDGRVRLHTQSLCDSFAARDGWLVSGMEIGVNDGYRKLDLMLADDAV